VEMDTGNKPVLWVLIEAAVLVLYGVVAALQPISEFGCVSMPLVAASSSPLPRVGRRYRDGFRLERYALPSPLVCVVADTLGISWAIITKGTLTFPA